MELACRGEMGVGSHLSKLMGQLAGVQWATQEKLLAEVKGEASFLRLSLDLLYCLEPSMCTHT